MPNLFDRGRGPLVSFLMPTRTRFQHAVASIESLHATCDNPRSIEVIARSDCDDQQSLSLPAAAHGRDANFKLIVGSPLRGYFSLHHFYNDCAALATGDWLMVWNDDCRMLTPHWDTLLTNLDYAQFPSFKGNSTVAAFNPAEINDHPDQPSGVFPAMRRASYKLLGCFSQHCHNDLWVNDVFNGAEANIYWNGIQVRHNHQLNDEVQFAGDRAQATSSSDYHTVEQVINRTKAIEILKKHL